MKKHILFILLSIFSLESIHAEIEWTLSDDGTLTISGTDMPNYYYRGPWDNEQDNIKKVIIEKGVTNIGDHAFYGFPFLTSVSIPNTVTTIGDHAFRNCPSLSSVSIGNSVTSIGDDAFNGCSSLTSISIPNSVVSIGNAAFISCI